MLSVAPSPRVRVFLRPSPEMPMVVATTSHHSPSKVADQEQSNRSHKIGQQEKEQLCVVHGHHGRADHNPSLRVEWRAKIKRQAVSGRTGQYHPPPAAQIRIPRAETRKKAEYRRPKPRPGISDFGFRPSIGPRISGFGFGPLRSRVGGTVQYARRVAQEENPGPEHGLLGVGKAKPNRRIGVSWGPDWWSSSANGATICLAPGLGHVRIRDPQRSQDCRKGVTHRKH